MVTRVTMLALCVLDEAMDQSRKGRVEPSLGLRLALAHLHGINRNSRASGTNDRLAYDMFWREATRRDDKNDTAAGHGRFQHINAAMNGIARAAGYELSELRPDMRTTNMHALQELRRLLTIRD